jgi:HEAT repeat protein
MGVEAVVPLISALGNENAEVRAEAAWALSGASRQLGPQARHLVPRLLELLDDEEQQQQDVLRILQLIDPSAVRTAKQLPQERP